METRSIEKNSFHEIRPLAENVRRLSQSHRLSRQWFDGHARSDQVGWMLFLDIVDQRFTNIATQSPQLIWIGRTDQCANLYRSFLGVSDHQRLFSLSHAGCASRSKKLLPEFVDGQMIIEVRNAVRRSSGERRRPVFERLLQSS